MAGESAGTDAETGTKQPVQKIRRLGDQPILYGGSGDVGLLQKIEANLQSFSPKNSLKRVRQELRRSIVPELADARETHVPYPAPGFHHPPAAILLFAGVHGGDPWIVEIERDGRDTGYGDDMGNFAAIGSGKPWAQAVFRPHLQTTRNIELGKVFACRVLEDAIDLAAGHIAPPIHIHTIGVDGTVQKVDSSEIERLKETCELWRELERESVGRLLTGGEPEEPDEPVPEPVES